MDIKEKVIKATQHLVLISPDSKKVKFVGSGCIIKYRSKLFLVTVEHVTNIEGLATCIETGYVIPDIGSKLYSVGGMMLIKSLSASNQDELKELLKIIDDPNKFNKIKNLDIAYVELKEIIDIYQKHIDFDTFAVNEGKKIIVETDLCGELDINDTYYYFGRIHKKSKGQFLVSQEKLVTNLKFKCEQGNYRIFSLPESIKNASEFEGMRGSPIMNSKGNIVAFLAYCYEGYPYIFGFSLKLLKSMLDI